MNEPILAVDLDGTLLRTDSLLELLFVALREQPLALGRALLRLPFAGRARFKDWLAARAAPDPDRWPLNEPLVEWLRAERARGRALVLATAADRRVAAAVAARVGLFDAVLASDGERNLKGPAKAAALTAHAGPAGFDYAGDARADLPVWRAARRAIVVGGPALERAARRAAEVERVFGPASGERLSASLRALRLHQWVKNLLLLLPLLAAHRFGAPELSAAALAVLVFGLTASAVYLLNDLLDLSADRRHPRKCRRPLAAGALPLAWGLGLAPLLLLAAFGLSLGGLPPAFTLALAAYLLLTTAYSFLLKRLPIVDVMTLAALYTLRIVAGAMAVAIPLSFWLLAFSMFVFLSLALSKRFTELQGLMQRGELTAAGRGWHVDDLPLIGSLGTAAGLTCVLVLALYIDSAPARQLYALPEALWLICPLLLYWIGRLWFKTHRAELHDDPVVFALRDRLSLVIGALTVGIAILATIGVPS